MKHTPFVYLFLIFCMLSTSLHSQNLKEKISDNFTLLSKYPQEKLYLHLDKPYYAAGERIYWKGYLINAISHIPYTGSNFIYIELVSSDDRIQNRYKIKRKNGSFYGSITLPPDIPAGEYYLRAYTQWMMNAGDAYFYYHKLRIGNSLDRSTMKKERDNALLRCVLRMSRINRYPMSGWRTGSYQPGRRKSTI